jgi:hypothetical protein
MSGIDDLMAESHDRWAHAMRRAQGVEDNGLGEAVKTYYTRYFPAGFFILVATGTIGGTLAFPGTPERWPTFLTFGVLLAALGVVVGGLVYNAKKVVPAAKSGRVNVLLSLESAEQKQVRRQIAGKAPIDSEHLSVTRAAAVQLRKGLATQLVLAPFFPLSFIPQAVNFALRGDTLAAWVMALGVGVIVIAFGLLVRDFRRAGRFLTRTAGQTAPGNAPL